MPLIAAGFAIGLFAGLGLAALAFSDRGLPPTAASPAETAAVVDAGGTGPAPAATPEIGPTPEHAYASGGPAAPVREEAVGLAPIEEAPLQTARIAVAEETRLAAAPAGAMSAPQTGPRFAPIDTAGSSTRASNAAPGSGAEPDRADDQVTGEVVSGALAALPEALPGGSADDQERASGALETSAPGALSAVKPPLDGGTTLATEESASSVASLAPNSTTAEPAFPATETAYPPLEIHLHAPETVLPAEVGLMVSDLDSRGFEVAEPKRVALTISDTQVRYFHPEDAAAADALAELLFAEARDFTTYRPSPPPGQVEVWLEGRAERAERRAAAPRRAVAPQSPAAGLAAAMSEIERGLDRLFGVR